MGGVTAVSYTLTRPFIDEFADLYLGTEYSKRSLAPLSFGELLQRRMRTYWYRVFFFL